MGFYQSGFVCFLFVIQTQPLLAGDISKNWNQDTVCGQRLPPFEELTERREAQTFCSQVHLDTRICARYDSAQSDNAQITLEYQGEVKKQWSTEIMPSLFEAKSFHLTQLDFDGDGKDELLFGVKSIESNGMGIQQWLVWAIHEGNLSEPLHMEDFGLMSFTTQSPGNKGCQLFVSQWSSGWDPKRGGGFYIVGRWFNLYEGKFIWDSQRPAVYRRYLSSLERQRNEHEDLAKPLLWFTSKQVSPVIGPYPF